LASTHQTGAVTVLSAFLFAMHTCRKVDPRHLKNLLGKLRAEDPQAFHNMMMAHNKAMLSKREYQMLQRQWTGKDDGMQPRL